MALVLTLSREDGATLQTSDGPIYIVLAETLHGSRDKARVAIKAPSSVMILRDHAVKRDPPKDVGDAMRQALAKAEPGGLTTDEAKANGAPF